MGRLVTCGKHLYDGERKFFARGVSYGPFHANSHGERYPERERAAADFAMMRELGANLVRVYVPPPAWLFELAAKYQLRIMAGIPWPFHMAFLDSPEMVCEIRGTIRRGVKQMREFGEVIAAYSLGNEVRSDIVRWYGARKVSGFLRELRDLGKQADPEGLFTYSNYPSAEYLDLSFLDLVCFNIYLHREADYRRYLTHVMAATGSQPLILSETGMDTIREGEQRQAELLSWQARAAFEQGLSGFVIFAFTDEWHTGGAEITDWAFGLVSRERRPKRAFEAVGQIFRSPMPPPLKSAPAVSVLVPAYNAASTLRQCLESLAVLHYPNYEVIVIDDGSTDATADIAQEAGVRVLRLDHRGLSAARNSGLEAARGRIAAFIDSDARAEPDWLYYLIEALKRMGAAAVGGPNFPPAPDSILKAAIAAAPGQPNEVRMGADELAQLCGCNMAIDRDRLADESGAPFDPAFERAGDDVDFSWRLRERGFKIAYAPGATVFHERRGSLRAYLRQQRGYGHAEGLLARRYPQRFNSEDGVYGGRGWMAAWLGAGARIYYGAFGRGLFQTVYPQAALPQAAQLPLTAEWVAFATLLLICGAFNRFFLALGSAAIAATFVSATLGAAISANRDILGIRGRAMLALLWIVGPLVRSYERARVRLAFAPALAGAPATEGRLRGKTTLSSGAASVLEAERAVGLMREALVKRGAAVVRSDGYESYDLELTIMPALRVPIVILRLPSEIAVGWRLRLDGGRVALAALALFILALLGGYTVLCASVTVAVLLFLTLLVLMVRASKVSRLIAAACADIATKFQPSSAAGPIAAEA